MYASPLAELRTYQLNSDGSAQETSVIPLPSALSAGSIPHVMIDEVHNLLFAVVVPPGTPPVQPDLLWYGFDPTSGLLSAQPAGMLANVNFSSMMMVGKYLVTTGPSAVTTGQSTVSVYSVTYAGPVLLSQQYLPLSDTMLVPVQ